MTLAVEFESVSRHFGAVRAVDDVSIGIAEGCFFAMLGPSGSGKTTCLQAHLGLRAADGGAYPHLRAELRAIPPNRRPVNTVFQDYALFPHLTVRENVAYGPKMAGVDRGRGRPRPRRCWRSSSSRATATASPRRSRAGSGSAWRSPARS
jgi:putative spermidine/putrescine transport system ATP-binding protein